MSELDDVCPACGASQIGPCKCNQRTSKLVLVHGCFDVLHFGHLEYFRSAKKFGDRLWVSVTSDRYVNKGPGRPVFTAEVRCAMIQELGIVDVAFVSDAPTAVEAIRDVRPDFYVKGPDYHGVDTPDLRAEIAAVEAVGGKFVCTDDATYSSSSLANRFFVNWTKEQQQVIDQVQELGGMVAVEDALGKVKSQVNCVVVGENIIDTYRFVKPEGISSKSPSISAKYLREEVYQGGALAIYNHVRGFCDVQRYGSDRMHLKTRYIAEENGQRLLEVTDLPVEPERVSKVPLNHNMLLVADFGHGLIDPAIDTDSFKALNVQTNSSNYGFNSFRRHQSFDYLVVDLRELRLAYQDRTTPPDDLGSWAHNEYGRRPVAVTMGPQGSLFFKDGVAYRCPAFCDQVVDAIGAGDAFLAITSLLVKTDAHPVLIGFLGNVFAGLKAKIIGNKSAVTKESLLRACTAILR